MIERVKSFDELEYAISRGANDIHLEDNIIMENGHKPIDVSEICPLWYGNQISIQGHAPDYSGPTFYKKTDKPILVFKYLSSDGKRRDWVLNFRNLNFDGWRTSSPSVLSDWCQCSEWYNVQFVNHIDNPFRIICTSFTGRRLFIRYNSAPAMLEEASDIRLTECFFESVMDGTEEERKFRGDIEIYAGPHDPPRALAAGFHAWDNHLEGSGITIHNMHRGRYHGGWHNASYISWQNCEAFDMDFGSEAVWLNSEYRVNQQIYPVKNLI